jgi:hypothetical protein
LRIETAVPSHCKFPVQITSLCGDGRYRRGCHILNNQFTTKCLGENCLIQSLQEIRTSLSLAFKAPYPSGLPEDALDHADGNPVDLGDLGDRQPAAASTALMQSPSRPLRELRPMIGGSSGQHVSLPPAERVSCELAPHGFGVERAIGNGPERLRFVHAEHNMINRWLVGWLGRPIGGLLMLGVLPALSIVYVRRYVKEPPVWVEVVPNLESVGPKSTLLGHSAFAPGTALLAPKPSFRARRVPGRPRA